MKRRLSSKQTFFLKIILPIFFVVISTTGFLVSVFGPRQSELLVLKIIIPTIIIFGIYSMYMTVMRYKKVLIDEHFLYVSNYRKEIKIPFSEIADVTEIKWHRTRPITIHLKTSSEFGRKIVFTPKFNGFRVFAENPIVAELKKLSEPKT